MVNPPHLAPPTSLKQYAVPAIWAFNAALLLAMCLWIFVDGETGVAANAIKARIAPIFGQQAAGDPAASLHYARVIAIVVAGMVSLSLLAALLVSLIVGPRRHRSIRSMLAFMTLIAAWLTLAASWPEIAWRGQKWRVNQKLAALQPLADALSRDWPTADGALPSLGPFMAYPRGTPSTLMLLAPPGQQSAPLPIASVERTSNGAICFELTGSEFGAWLEWSPTDDGPRSFTSGLEAAYTLERSEPLGHGWFLTRYL